MRLDLPRENDHEQIRRHGSPFVLLPARRGLISLWWANYQGRGSNFDQFSLSEEEDSPVSEWNRDRGDLDRYFRLSGSEVDVPRAGSRCNNDNLREANTPPTSCQGNGGNAEKYHRVHQARDEARGPDLRVSSRVSRAFQDLVSFFFEGAEGGGEGGGGGR